MLDFGAIFAAILGSAGLFSLIQFFVNRHDHKVNDFTIIKKELKLEILIAWTIWVCAIFGDTA